MSGPSAYKGSCRQAGNCLSCFSLADNILDTADWSQFSRGPGRSLLGPHTALLTVLPKFYQKPDFQNARNFMADQTVLTSSHYRQVLSFCWILASGIGGPSTYRLSFFFFILTVPPLPLSFSLS